MGLINKLKLVFFRIFLRFLVRLFGYRNIGTIRVFEDFGLVSGDWVLVFYLSEGYVLLYFPSKYGVWLVQYLIIYCTIFLFVCFFLYLHNRFTNYEKKF